MKLLITTYQLELPDTEPDVENEIKEYIINKIDMDHLIKYSHREDEEGNTYTKGELQFYRIEKENPEN